MLETSEIPKMGPTELGDQDVEQPKNIEDGMETEDQGIEKQEELDVADAGQMEKSVVTRAVETFKDKFKNEIDNLSNRAKRRVSKALVVLFLATTVAGIIPTEFASAAEPDHDKDQIEQKGNYSESDPEEILGFQVDFMSPEDAQNIIDHAIDSVKSTSPDGQLLSSNQAMESGDDFNRDIQGELPQSGENIIVRGVSTNAVYESQGDNPQQFDNYGSYDEVVQVDNVEPIGEAFDMTGQGDTEQSAIQGALENSGQFIQTSVSSKLASHTTEIGDSYQSEFQEHLQSTYDQAIASYKVVKVHEVEQNGITFYEAQINVQPGQVVN